MRIGVIGLQGAVTEHVEAVRRAMKKTDLSLIHI